MCVRVCVYVCSCVCVCVCEREKEKEREREMFVIVTFHDSKTCSQYKRDKYIHCLTFVNIVAPHPLSLYVVLLHGRTQSFMDGRSKTACIIIAGITPSDHALVFVDNHETQRTHPTGIPQLSFREPKLYTMATAFTLAYNYGFVRIMSSYNFTDADSGPPSHADFSTKVMYALGCFLRS